MFFTGLHYRNPYPRAVSNNHLLDKLDISYVRVSYCGVENFLFCSLNVPVDIPTTNGTGNSERQEDASATALEEAGQANILRVT